MPCTTSSASAMPGTAFGLTKETIWIWSIPVCASASISAIFRAVGMAPFSNWNPSRGPSSLMCTRFGKSLMTPRSSWFSERDNRTLTQSVDLIWRKPELGQNFGRVLADRRRLAAQRQIVIADFDRQPRDFGVHAAGKYHVEHAAAGVELRIVEQVAGLGNRRERNIDTVEQFDKLSQRVPGDDRGDLRPQHGARAHAVLVGLVGRVLQKIVAGKMLAEAAPLPVAGQPDEDLFAIGGLERIVDAPGAFPGRHRRRRAAGHRLAGPMLRHQEGGGFEQRRLDHLAAAGALGLAQCSPPA